MMGHVKKTITEAIGETSVTTSIEFETYENFMAYEKSLNASQAEFSIKPVKISVNGDIEIDGKVSVKEPEWTDHDGSDECPVTPGSDCEVMFGDGDTCRDHNPEGWSWYWEVEPDGCQIAKYRVFN